ncbi:MAG TPA: hypothetical protein VKH42_18555 [Vicinamibacterales bacterium]|nr:hypothetical protein [Vicinamibacterales bacterium]
MKRNWAFIVPAAICGMIIVTFLGGKIVEWLWNWLMPQLFGWRSITFWQAWGLLALTRILFGGMHVKGGGGDHRVIRHRLVDKMADRVAERWEAMSPEERERFRVRLRDRMGVDPTT